MTQGKEPRGKIDTDIAQLQLEPRNPHLRAAVSPVKLDFHSRKAPAFPRPSGESDGASIAIDAGEPNP
jgi:hypothetical protein